MTGDDRARHCGQCKKDVFNISGMTRDEAQELMIEKNGELCVRYFQRKDGTILLKDCSIGISQKRKRRVIAAGVALLLGGTALLAFKRPTKGPETKWVPVSLVPFHETTPSEELINVAGGIGPGPIEPPHVMMGAPPRVDPKKDAKHTSPKKAKGHAK